MNKRAQFLVDISRLILYANDNGIRLICFDFDRDESEQERYVFSGKSWTRDSRHFKWRAMDLAIVEGDPGKVNFENDYSEDYEKYEKLGNFWESLGSGHVWGAGVLSNGKRIDVYHFELR